jgi:hypothetical protein
MYQARAQASIQVLVQVAARLTNPVCDPNIASGLLLRVGRLSALLLPKIDRMKGEILDQLVLKSSIARVLWRFTMKNMQVLGYDYGDGVQHFEEVGPHGT